MKLVKQLMHNLVDKRGKTLIALLAFLLLFVFVSRTGAAAVNAMEPDREKEVRDSVESILKDREFSDKKLENSTMETIALGIKKLIDDIKERIKKLFSRIQFPDMNLAPLPEGVSPAAAMALKSAGILIIALLLFLLLFFISRNFRNSKYLKQQEDRELLLSLKDSSLIFQKALELAAKGDFRQGIRHLYIALLLHFNEIDLIKIDKSKTNKQYLGEIKNGGFEHFDMVLEFTRDFNRFWYGNMVPGSESFDLWRNRFNLLVKEVEKKA